MHAEESWREGVPCVGDTETFFPPERMPNAYRMRVIAEAKQVCAGCPAVEPCLDYAMQHRIRDGVWGGLSEDERDKLALRGRWRGRAS